MFRKEITWVLTTLLVTKCCFINAIANRLHEDLLFFYFTKTFYKVKLLSSESLEIFISNGVEIVKIYSVFIKICTSKFAYCFSFFYDSPCIIDK